MTVIGTKYLYQCKANYYKGIRPAREETHEEEGYKALVAIAIEYFDKQKENEFIGFFQEYQYNVNLWTAHLIIDYGKPNRIIIDQALEIIERYSETPLDEELALEEKKWLNNYLLS